MRRSTFFALTLALAACSQPNPLTGKGQVQFYDPDEEVALGREAASEVQDEFGGFYQDPAAQEYVDSIVRRIGQTAPGIHYPYSGRILDTHVLNAFSLPGGPVFITRGLLARMQNESQLAGVLGHEVAHVAGRHGTNRISEAELSQAILLVGTVVAYTQVDSKDRDTVVAGAVVASVINQLYHLGHSREHEYQADEFGAEFAWQNGYDPRSLGEVFRMFMAYRKEVGAGPEPELLQTHPKDEKRIAEIEKLYAEKYGKPHGDAFAYNQPQFEQATAQLRRDKEALAKYDQAKGHAARKSFGAALPLIEQAIAAAPHYSSFYVVRGRALEGLGRHGEALEAFKQACLTNGDNPEAQMRYGMALSAAGRHADAETALAKSVQLSPTNPDARAAYAGALEARGDRKRASKEARKAQALSEARESRIR